MTVTPKQLANLKPITSKRQARELGKKGGKAKTEAKKLAAIIRELKKKSLTPIQAKYLALIQEGKLDLVSDGLLSELISMKIDEETPKAEFYRKLNLLDRLIKKLPAKSMNLNIDKVDGEITIKWADKEVKK